MQGQMDLPINVPAEPYNDLPPLPPLQVLESVPVLKATIRARTALSDLKGAGRLIPNPAMLVRSLLLQEARLSSHIENIVTTNDAIYRALNHEEWETHPHVKEVLRYSEALWHGVMALRNGRTLSSSLFVEIASEIKGAELHIRDLPGTVIHDTVAQQTIYTPPVGADRIRNLLDNLSDFYYSDNGLDPLVKMAIGHYQFEAIHPFRDGNGRTGRVVNLLYLVETKLLETPVLYMSRAILQNKRAYYEGLRSVTTSGAWEPWVLYMLDVVEVTARDTTDRIERITNTMKDVTDLVKERAPRVYSRELIELIFSQPYTRIIALERAGIARRETASKHLKALEQLGVLTSSKIGRDLVYLNPRLMEILSA